MSIFATAWQLLILLEIYFKLNSCRARRPFFLVLVLLLLLAAALQVIPRALTAAAAGRLLSFTKCLALGLLLLGLRLLLVVQ